MKFYKMTDSISNIKRDIHKHVVSQLGRERLCEAFEGFDVRERTYHTWPLFQIFLNQVASGMSCGESIAWGISQRLLPMKTSPRTSAYCNAKTRLPEKPIFELMKSVGCELESHTHWNRKPFGRNVKVVDGTSVQLQDTAANQRVYPQSAGQKPGCGQPHLKMCVLMGFASGAIIDCEVGVYRDPERTLFRELWRSLNEGDILLGDRGFGSYAEVALLQKKGVDFVFRQQRKSIQTKDATEVRKDDWDVIWKRPQQAGRWVSRNELPERMNVRAIRLKAVKGSRTDEVILFTSLTDRNLYPRKKLLELYYRRWEMELRIRDIKSSMGLDLLRSKTPAGCRKELLMGLLAYNLVRAVMLDAAHRGRSDIARISFKTTLDLLDTFSQAWFAEGDLERAYLWLLDCLIKRRVPYRPGRVEPRKIKRRKTCKYSYMTTPRNLARNEVCSA